MAERITRRAVLRLLGAAGATALVGYELRDAPAKPRSAQAARRASVQACTLTPRDIDDPGFVDGVPDRSDIRVDTLDGSVVEGIPLRLELFVYRVGMDGCDPLSGAQVTVWNCDARGIYSQDRDAGTAGRTFLRGYQVTDSDGAVEFLTIYPGWYPGRTTHVHFKVRDLSGPEPTLDFTSQLYFDDAVSNRVLALPPYAANGPKDVGNDRDGFYLNRSADGRVAANMGAQLMLDLSQEGDGYVGRFDIGLPA